MFVGKVWSQFGRIRKLRIHDMSKDLSEAVIDLFLRYFDTEEPLHRAASNHLDTARCPETFKLDEDYRKSLSDPNFSCVICSPDDSDEVTDIMGISTMMLARKYVSDIDKERDKPIKKERENICAMCKELYANHLYNPVEQCNLISFYDERGLFVVPDFGRLGIASKLLKKRRLKCEGIPMTGAWIVSAGTQIAAARNGYETVAELPYKDLSKRHGVVFIDVVTSMKYSYIISRAQRSIT